MSSKRVHIPSETHEDSLNEKSGRLVRHIDYKLVRTEKLKKEEVKKLQKE